METVPAKVPREKIRAQTRAMTRVGRVRIRPRRTRSRLTMTLLRSMLLEASTATGRAQTQPMTVPRMDILMVSSRGRTTLGKNSHLGRNSFSRMATMLPPLRMMTVMSKPVIRSDQITASTTQRAISGRRLRGRSTVLPFARVMVWGLKIRSNSGVLVLGGV